MLFLCEEFLLHIPCCLNVYTGSFSYTSRAVLISTLGVSLTHPMQVFSFFIWWISLTDPVLVSFFSFLLFFLLSRAFVIHILCWLDFYLGCFSYTSRAGFIFTGGVSLTHPVLASILSGEKHIPRNTSFLSGEKYIPRWLHSYAGCFSNTSHADSFHVGSFSYTSLAAFIFMRGVCLTHPVLP